MARRAGRRGHHRGRERPGGDGRQKRRLQHRAVREVHARLPRQPAAEYNIWVDPEAARIVFHSGLPILMVGWEHCRGKAALDAADMKHVRSFRTPLADFTLDCNAAALKAATEWLGDPGLTLPDPV